ncbi:helix-turn-helix domain-containing protein [Streptomyces sp. MNU76]|uniref:IclR family transcriptional regulator n=1 Tax=Streptomyces sp. MNU76 TaxID=2560026 RepID=UPI001E2F9B42|nr:helix-turn-helix domain-containing protein [Streptomyces sp. MNU76]MCC9705899.1 helix-turn-helix domain-containing protein [Streptomyces sp. MNU76]
MAATGGETSLTLDRGLTVLSLLARNADGLTAAELAEQLTIARAAVYRLLRTLEAHNLVARLGTRYILGFGVAELAGQLKPRLQATVLPILRRLSEQTNSTALLSVADGDQALILLTAEPPNSTMHLAMREGARHALTVGADGIAILAGRPDSDADTEHVREARRRGYAVSVGSIQEGAIGIAAPIRVSDWSTASLGVVQLGLKLVDDRIPHLVTEAAGSAATQLVGTAGPEAVGR